MSKDTGKTEGETDCVYLHIKSDVLWRQILDLVDTFEDVDRHAFAVEI